MKSGNLNFLEPSGPLQACNGTALITVYNYTSDARTCERQQPYVVHRQQSSLLILLISSHKEFTHELMYCSYIPYRSEFIVVTNMSRLCIQWKVGVY